jgi:hypothetical protein
MRIESNLGTWVGVTTPSTPCPEACRLEGFSKTPHEHIVEELDKPVVVSSVAGVIVSAAGEWPDDAVVTFALRSTQILGELREVRTDSRGYFSVPDVSHQDYCFKATAAGWRSIVGMIVVSKGADQSARVNLRMRLGV